MAHSEQSQVIGRLKSVFPKYFYGSRVLDVGSLDINGSARIYFDNCAYIGVDIGEGNGVDIISKGEDLTYPDGHFDVALSCECFEHNPEWAATFANMVRMTCPGGLVIMTCATTGREEHGTSRRNPQDAPLMVAQGIEYYKNLDHSDFINEFGDELDKWFATYQFTNRDTDLYFVGIKNNHHWSIEVDDYLTITNHGRSIDDMRDDGDFDGFDGRN